MRQAVSGLGATKKYPKITVAQLGDIFIEDATGNPEMAGEVERLGLVARSKSWFAGLFRREGWVSPAAKPQRARDGRVAHPIREPAPRRGMLVHVDATPPRLARRGRRRRRGASSATTSPSSRA